MIAPWWQRLPRGVALTADVFLRGEDLQVAATWDEESGWEDLELLPGADAACMPKPDAACLTFAERRHAEAALDAAARAQLEGDDSWI